MTGVFQWLAVVAIRAAHERVRAALARRATVLARRTGLLRVWRLLGYVALDLPKTTTVAGVVLLLGTAAIRVSLIVGFDSPTYLNAYFALLAAVCVVASAAMVTGSRRRLVRAGWWLGALAAASSIGMYLAGHTAGLPGLPLAAGRWNYPLGTFAMILLAAYLVAHASVVAKVSVAYPDSRGWHD